MQKVFGENYIRLGEDLQNLRTAFYVIDNIEAFDVSEKRDEHEADCRRCLKNLIKTCEELSLSRAQELASYAYDDLPQTTREFDQLVRAVMADIKQTFFLYVPAHLAKYHDHLAEHNYRRISVGF
jgi:hypothetical protein